MPYMKGGKRDYKTEYNKYHARDEQKKNRSNRNKARRLVAKAKGQAAIKGKDIDHRKPISKGGDNGLSNLFAVSPSKNRSFKRKSNGKMA
ncbi:MAG: HNH endonuclease [Leptolyngbyaceae bacterium]|nr:HNH endonuclease [Leptolyngbyaceae bacterium]